MRSKQKTAIELFNEFSQWYTSSIFESDEVALNDTWIVYEMGKTAPVMLASKAKYPSGITRFGSEVRAEEEERYIEKVPKQMFLKIMSVSESEVDVIENLGQSLKEGSIQSSIYKRHGKKHPDYVIHATMCKKEITDERGTRKIDGLFLAVFISEKQFISGVFEVVKTEEGEFQCRPGLPSIHQKEGDEEN